MQVIQEKVESILLSVQTQEEENVKLKQQNKDLKRELGLLSPFAQNSKDASILNTNEDHTDKEKEEETEMLRQELVSMKQENIKIIRELSTLRNIATTTLRNTRNETSMVPSIPTIPKYRELNRRSSTGNMNNVSSNMLKWTKDNESSICTICDVTRFTLFNRRHHCRQCGRLCCDACGPKRNVKNSPSKLRMCLECVDRGGSGSGSGFGG